MQMTITAVTAAGTPVEIEMGDVQIIAPNSNELEKTDLILSQQTVMIGRPYEEVVNHFAALWPKYSL
jgi:hypothetical protein